MSQHDENIKTRKIKTTFLLETVMACYEGRATFKSLFKLDEQLYKNPLIENDKDLEKVTILLHEFKLDITNGKMSQELMKNYFNDILRAITLKE